MLPRPCLHIFTTSTNSTPLRNTQTPIATSNAIVNVLTCQCASFVRCFNQKENRERRRYCQNEEKYSMLSNSKFHNITIFFANRKKKRKALILFWLKAHIKQKRYIHTFPPNLFFKMKSFFLSLKLFILVYELSDFIQEFVIIHVQSFYVFFVKKNTTPTNIITPKTPPFPSNHTFKLYAFFVINYFLETIIVSSYLLLFNTHNCCRSMFTMFCVDRASHSIKTHRDIDDSRFEKITMFLHAKFFLHRHRTTKAPPPASF